MCSNPSCVNESASFNGLCIYCHKFWDGKEKPAKKAYQIPKESEKRKKLNRIDQKQNKELRKKIGKCQINSPVCTGKADGTQHILGRKGGNLIDIASKLVSCNPCNDWCESHSLEAQRLGLAGSKHKTVKKVADVLATINNKKIKTK